MLQYSAVVRVDSQGLTTTSLDLTELRDGNSRCNAYEDTDVCDFNILKCQKVLEVCLVRLSLTSSYDFC
jgi:hypothetical protein